MRAGRFFSKKSSFWWVGLFLLVTHLQGKVNVPFNKVVLEAVATMPHGGGYSTSSEAMRRLEHAVMISNGKLIIHVPAPSFCSEAVYLVFLKAILLLEERRELVLDPVTLVALLPRCEPDGEGIWGRWNANGPGVACFFQALGADSCMNFTELARAEPGDFLKIFWNDSLGGAEHGHLVIYLGHEIKNDVEMIHFWSSNQHVGYGDKWVPLRSVKRLLFSRLLDPVALNNGARLSRCDPYLASLLMRSTTWKEVKEHSGISK